LSSKLKDLIPMLMCHDVQRSIAFYRETLGFEVVDRMDDAGRSGWASLRNGQARIMLASPKNVHEAPRINGRHTQAVHYFYPEDVAALHESLVAAGRRVTDLSVRSYGMKEFELVDPDGHVLVFGQETDEPVTPEKAGSTDSE
jgi:uncharacterized glyoxalase superfamily protein PhnB